MGKQNEKLIKNMKLYEQKEETKQQKSKVLGQKPTKYQGNKEKSTRMYHSWRSKSIRSMVWIIYEVSGNASRREISNTI